MNYGNRSAVKSMLVGCMLFLVILLVTLEIYFKIRKLSFLLISCYTTVSWPTFHRSAGHTCVKEKSSADRDCTLSIAWIVLWLSKTSRLGVLKNYLLYRAGVHIAFWPAPASTHQHMHAHWRYSFVKTVSVGCWNTGWGNEVDELLTTFW